MALTALPLVLSLASLSNQGDLPQAWDVQNPTQPGVRERMDEHGHVARAFVDSPGGVEFRRHGGALALVASNWSALGPFGGDVSDVASSPINSSLVLASLAPSSGGGGMFRSDDAGATWTEVGSLSGLAIYDIEFDPAGIAYIGTLDGVQKSVDGGLNWTNQPLGIGLNDQTYEVTIDPNDSTRIWAGVADALGNQSNTLLLSTNSGGSWTPMVPPGGPYSFTAIEVEVGDSNKVFAAWRGGFGGGGFFVSADGGATWTDRSAGLPGNPMNDLLHDGTRLLLCGGQLFGSQDVGVYTTPDEGVTWTELSDGTWPVRAITDLELDPSNSSRILVTSQGDGVFESTDGGANWSFAVGGTGGTSGNGVHFASTTEVYVGSASVAVWKSTDGGANYAASSVGIGQLDVYSVATNPNDAQEIAIAYQGQNNGGVQSTTDGGATWTSEAVPGTRYNTVGFDASGVLFAISDGPTTIGAEGLYRRSGAVWTSIGPDQGSVFESELVALAFDPQNANTILSGGGDFGVAGFEPTVWKTTDGGANWTKAYEGPVDNEDVVDLAYPSVGTNQVVACYTDFGASQSGGALRSTDNGDNWSDSSTGLPAGAQGFDLDVAPDGTTLLFADGDAGGGNGGLHSSADGGATWSTLNSSGTTYSVVHNPSDGSELFTSHFSVPKAQASSDGGVTLGAYDNGLFTSGAARDLHMGPGGATLFLATNQGVWTTSFGVGTSVCRTSPNSVGAGALISGEGSSSVGANDLTLVTVDLPANKPGLYYYGPATQQIPFGNGFRCISGGGVGIFRLGTVTSSAGGVATYAVDYTAQTLPNGIITAGSKWFFQFWYRDPNQPPSDFNLSDALEVDFVM